jgi:trimethylamine--corrinoid protein Co-methyltransferase
LGIVKGYGLRQFSEDEIKAIHNASVDVLEKVGVRVDEPEAFERFREHGCDTDANSRVVKIPEYLVDYALSKVPSRITLYGRDRSKLMHLTGLNVYFGTGAGCPYVWENGERRSGVKRDAETCVRVSDFLDHVDFAMACVVPNDQPDVSQDLHEFELMARNTSKPMVAMAYKYAHGAKLAEMASVIAGGDEELRKRPIVALYTEPVSPLILEKDATRNFLDFAERGLPTVFVSSPIGGLTAPITLAGLVTLNNAEALAGIALGQITRPGTPMIHGGGTAVMDVYTAEPDNSGPEYHLAASAGAQLARFYGIPTWGHAGLTHSRDVDAQAVGDAVFNIMVTAFSGQNLVHDLGFMDTTLTYSPDLLVICDDIVGKVKRFLRGIEVNDETIAFDVIDRIGIGNSYLSDIHTLSHTKSELYISKLVVREEYNKWIEKGRISMIKRAQEETKSILGKHKPLGLDSHVSGRLDSIIREVEKTSSSQAIS